jgi:hypothetical protein
LLSTGRNLNTIEPLPSLDDIAVIGKSHLDENAILIAQTEIACLDNLSLDGDIPDNILDN